TIQEGRHTLIAAHTGSGKTLAAFLAAIDALVRESLVGTLPDTCQVLYVSPLKALSNDIQRNLQQPLAGIGEELKAMGLPQPEIRVLVRTGDTPASERAAMIRRPPHILVTTPESLYILLTSEGGRRILKTVRQVIVDEIHALVGDKRGSHLALSLERLQALTGAGLVRVGLSATQRPIETVARFLVGCGPEGASGNPPACSIVDVGHRRKLDLAMELPDSPLEAVMSLEVWEEVFNRLAALVEAHRTTLIFVNTRRMAERLARHLSERLGEEHVSSHHGSMSKEHRLTAEQRLKAGTLRALVATASLELGIDIGAVELVCQLASPRSITAFLQRVGRSGHTIGGLPRGRLFPLSRDDLVECAALLDAVRRGELDTLTLPDKPLDILAQQIVAAVACEEWSVDDLFHLVRRAYPYRDLARGEFDRVVRMLAEGFSARRGRRGAHLHWDAVNGRLRGRKGARLAAVTSGGAIPDNADYDVILEPAEIKIGTLNEDFAIESMAGDIFQLGNSSWRILRVESGKVRVEDAQGQPPTIPFWLGEAPGRTHELSAAVSRLRAELAERLGTLPSTPGDAPKPSNEEGGSGHAGSTTADSTTAAPTAATIIADAGSPWGEGAAAALAWLKEEVGLSASAAEQLTDYLAAARAALGVMPTQQTLVMERFFDEAGGMQLVIHSPYGSRLNRAWGLALRKRFCRKFNFELQAAALEDAIVLSLGPTHSFPLQDVYRYLHSASVRDLLIQAMLDAPMFTTRWRWNAARALALLRWRSGRKVPAPLQRMDAEDLMAVVFPDQLACLENVAGDRDIPDHPLVNQTIHDCLTEAMDIEALEALLRAMECGDVRMVARDMAEPSPLAQEILNAKPYAFLDDAPLEERRTQAVISRRWLDADSAAELGALDVAALTRVRVEAWPQPTSADEMHDALVLLGYLTEREVRAEGEKQPEPAQPAEQPSLPFPAFPVLPGGSPLAPEPLPGAETFSATGWPGFLASLASERRATLLRTSPEGPALWVAAERLPELLAVHPGAALEPVIAAPAEFEKPWEKQEALVEL
ncbi:MAG: DEAD/DEAH box helicase, partial [SAR324 cluster bacterium]|nr:DEAD/DEAH box helicase [SAR324 cluster bacterium]